MNATQTANALGMAGIGIGLTEIAAPGLVERALGIGNHHTLLRTMGLREIASGAAVLRNPEAGMWSRVAGDALDIALLGAAVAKSNRRVFAFGALAAVLVIAYMDLRNASDLSR